MANQFTLKNGGYEPFIGNYGLVPQPPIPTPESTDNGKVLGVSEGQYALVNGGGGGGVTPLLVTLTATKVGEVGTIVFDKTYAEVKEAYTNGIPIIVFLHSEYEESDTTYTDDVYERVLYLNEATENGVLTYGAVRMVNNTDEYIVSSVDEYPTCTYVEE